MPQPLHLLIAEDNPQDAELLVRSLHRAGFEPEWCRVDTEKAYLEHLHGGLDLILSDYEMPQFSALRALELLKQSGLGVPLIIVSGTIGEDMAVGAMKLGATDYLLKDRLARLGLSINHALDQSRMLKERRNAEAALRVSEARYHGTLNSMMEGCQIISHDWRYLYINETAAQHGRRKKEELLGRTMMESFPGIQETEIFGTLYRCMTERKIVRVENEFSHEDGSKSWFELSIQPVPEGIFILSLDITERKRSIEKIREQLDELLRWQEVMLNREDRVQALKAEVNDLLAQQNLPPRYSDPAVS